MFGSSRSGVNAYAQVGMETGVLAASPHRLITMLYDGAITAIGQASRHMEAGNIEQKGEAIAKAVTIIITGLKSGLNMEAGGELSDSLASLYDYMARRLFEAHVKNDPEMLEEVKNLLAEIRGAWDEIGSSADAAAAVASIEPADMPPAVNDPLAPRKTLTMRA